MNVSKFNKLTSWNAQYDIKEMIKSQFEYLLDNKLGGGNGVSTSYPLTYKWQ